MSEYDTNSLIFEENYDNDAMIKCAKQIVSPINTGVMWTILAYIAIHKGRFIILEKRKHCTRLNIQVDIGCYYDLLDEKGRLYGVEYIERK